MYLTLVQYWERQLEIIWSIHEGMCQSACPLSDPTPYNALVIINFNWFGKDRPDFMIVKYIFGPVHI